MIQETDCWEYEDITLALNSELPFWPQSYGVRLEWRKLLTAGHDCNASILHCDIHAGTHLDAPYHHLSDGHDVTGFGLAQLCGSARVVDIPGVRSIQPDDLDRIDVPDKCKRLLIRTENNRLWRSAQHASFFPGYTALSEAGARWVVERKISLVGIDYLSIQPFQSEPLVHQILLDAGTAVLEGIDLNGVESGAWELICLPLRLVGAEGSPVRAILRRPAKKTAGE